MKKWFLLGLLFLGLKSMAQTPVTVTYYDDTVQQFQISLTGKLYFSGDDLQVLTDDAATPTSIPVSIIRKITLSGALSTTSVGANAAQFALYPNPGSGSVRISAPAYEKLDVSLYNLRGQKVQQGTYFPDQDIDVTALQTGLYLVQINQTTLKFVKQ